MSTDREMSSFTQDMLWNYGKYVRVTPEGFHLYDDVIVKELSVSLRNVNPARTLYEKRKPVCRSIDAVKNISGTCACSSCRLRSKCTPQIYLEFMYQYVPLRLLLAYTSARNFVKFSSETTKRLVKPITVIQVQLSTIDRGRWTEVRFAVVS